MALDFQSIYQGFQDTADAEMSHSNDLSDFFGWTHHGETARNIDLKGLEFLANHYEAGLQRDWLESMWNKNNEYNTPMAQMQRARAAGLNPSLLYGQPIAESQPASGGAEASIGVGNPAIAGSGAARDLSSLTTLAAQTDLMRAQAEEVRSRVPLNEKRVSHLESVIERNQKELEVADAEIAYKQVLGDKLGQDVYESQVRVTQMQESFPLKLQELESRIRDYNSSADKNEADASFIREQTKYYYENLLKQWELANSNIEALKASAVDSYARASLSLADEELTSSKNQLQQLQNDVYADTGRAQAIVGMVTDILGSVGNIINIGSRVVTRSAALKQRGKSKRTYTKTTQDGNVTRSQSLTELE